MSHEQPMAPSFPNPPNAPAGVEAPGAKAARVCGVLAILFALTCVGLPVAIVLGIVALVQQSKAKALQRQNPHHFRPVSATGMVTGIVSLVLCVAVVPMGGIVAAVAIPAMLGQRARAQDKALMVNVQRVRERAEALVAPPLAPEPDAVLEQLVRDEALRDLRNPFDPSMRGLDRAGEATPFGVVTVQVVVGEGGTREIWVRAPYKRPGGEVAFHEARVALPLSGGAPPAELPAELAPAERK